MNWLISLLRGPFGPALGVSLVFTGLAVQLAPGGSERAAKAVFHETGSLVPEEGETAAARIVGATEGASVHHLVIEEGVKPHYHRAHDETVIVLAGEGRVSIGEVERSVRPGLVLVIPRGAVHSLEVTGDPVEAVSVFSPPFDGKDRIFVD